MTQSDLELGIIQAIVNAERDARVTFDEAQRSIFRIGFIFGAEWYQKRIKAQMDANREEQS